VPGFAMARTQASVTYDDGQLVASAVPVQYVAGADGRDRAGLLVARDVIAASVGLDVRSRVEGIRSSVSV
jgi:hypothetical protein